eukprot:scaffold7310_cov116-Isochrysis_galbana.AAC.7
MGHPGSMVTSVSPLCGSSTPGARPWARACRSSVAAMRREKRRDRFAAVRPCASRNSRHAPNGAVRSVRSALSSCASRLTRASPVQTDGTATTSTQTGSPA